MQSENSRSGVSVGAASSDDAYRLNDLLYDDEEIEKRKKEQMLGNMYLITELYIARQLSGMIIKTCIDDL